MNVSLFLKLFATDFRLATQELRPNHNADCALIDSVINGLVEKFQNEYIILSGADAKKVLNNIKFHLKRSFFVNHPPHPEIIDKVTECFNNMITVCCDLGVKNCEELQELRRMHAELTERIYQDHPLFDDSFHDYYSVQLSIDQIRKIFAERGVLQLKPFDPKSDTLLIGCGQGYLGGGANGKYQHELIEALENAESPREFFSQHKHINEITVDLEFEARPHLIAAFGMQPLAPLFSGKKFKQVIVEGCGMNEGNRLWYDDVLKLLDEDGVLILRWEITKTITKKELMKKGFEFFAKKLSSHPIVEFKIDE